jgi:hypothetical protein
VENTGAKMRYPKYRLYHKELTFNEVEDEGHFKNFDVIFVFVKVFCTVRCFF